MDNMENPVQKNQTETPGSKKRINTQIHRRSKAKAVYPLADEWEDSSPLPPQQLRMPSSKMKKTATDRSQKV